MLYISLIAEYNVIGINFSLNDMWVMLMMVKISNSNFGEPCYCSVIVSGVEPI